MDASTPASNSPSERMPALRKIDPQRWTKPLKRRRDTELPFDASAVRRGGLVLLDATVYVDGLRGKLPRDIAEVLAKAAIVHSSVVRGEIAFSIACLDPAEPKTPD